MNVTVTELPGRGPSGKQTFTALFVRRPILALVFNTLMVVAGLAAYAGDRGARTAGCRPPGRDRAHHVRRRCAADDRPGADEGHRGRSRARQRAEIDLLAIAVRPKPGDAGVLRYRRSRRSPQTTCAMRSGASWSSCRTMPTPRRSSRRMRIPQPIMRLAVTSTKLNMDDLTLSSSKTRSSTGWPPSMALPTSSNTATRKRSSASMSTRALSQAAG